MKKAVILADYGVNTGMGHLMRCGTLARQLAPHYDVSFAHQNDSLFDHVSKFAEEILMSAVPISDSSRIHKEISADLIVVDSYGVTEDFFTDIKSSFGICAAIDDNMPLSFYDVDIIINQNAGAQKYKYPAREDSECLLGLDYLLLRDEFAKRSVIDISEPVKNIVITMGGADVKNTTEKFLRLLEKKNDFTFDVIVGAAFKNIEILKKYEKKYDNIILHQNANMSERFSKCQGAIAACGSTVYELSSMGIPTIGVITADNQIKASKEMVDCGLICSVGYEENISEDYFYSLCDSVFYDTKTRQRMHENQISLVARDGAAKIKNKILNRKRCRQA